MKKRILSILFIFAIALAFIPSFNGKAYANEESVRIRIEGKNGELYNQEVKKVNGEVALDLLKRALGEENIKGTDGTYGFLIEELYGEKGEKKEGYTTSWGLYVDKGQGLESPQVGVSTLEIDEETKEVLLHIKATDLSWSDLTYIPKLEVLQENGKTKIIAKKIVITYDENWQPIETEERLEGVKLEIEGKEYISDANGEVEAFLTPGKYDVKISKETQDYPELVRCILPIEMKENKFEENEGYNVWSEKKENIDPQKVWRIQFNQEILESSLENNIVVVDKEKNILPTQIKISEENNKVVQVIGPQKGYDQGEYTLYIKNKIASKEGNVLKKGIKMIFSVK